MASSIRVISTSNIHLASQNSDSTRKIELGPWDLQVLLLDLIQVGFVYHDHPHSNRDTVIQHLKASISSTLDYFPQLAGRLAVIEHDDDGTYSVFIHCNNAGALFIHATAEGLTISDILRPDYLPPIVWSFYPLTDAKNYECMQKPLLAVKVTELVDGMFIGVTINHALGDRKSIMHFLTCWSEIARGVGLLSKPPTLQRWFPGGTERPMRIRIPKDNEKEKERLKSPLPPPQERVFHFSKEKIAELKAKANATLSSNYKISSPQALMAHLWRAIVRNQGIDPKEEVNFKLVVDIRPRLNPPLPPHYFGNALDDGTVRMTAGELLHQEGLGKAASEMNKVVASFTEETIGSHLKSWLEDRRLLTISEMFGDAVDMDGSPTFNVYGVDLGWGKPVAVRSGPGDKSNGTITVFAGPEKGDVYAEVNLPYEIMEAMGRDSEFMDAVMPAVGFFIVKKMRSFRSYL
ncbi:hypothetical protein QN277_016775 [Acacia crassicarpa]|uniref:Uncharacterized protein n=1 Tax=Acacia crassicarpa TaxID=499986 RepID=A0AAE1MXG1_9FABA|nr:hypothetical protein QN277_016775 [Acacia crassicarpa]